MSKKKRSKYASQDYTESMLPQNRKQVFFDVLKLNWQKLLLLGLILLLFCVPLIILSFFEQSSLTNLITSDVELTDEQLVYLVFSKITVFELIKIPCFLILFVGLSGIIRVIRQYAWEENVFFWHDFVCGIKDNVWQMLLSGLLFGVGNWLAVFCATQVSLVKNGIQSVILYVPVFMFVLLLLPVTFYLIVCISIYKAKMGMQFKMAFSTFAKLPFQTYLVVVCSLALFALFLIPNTIAYFVTSIVLPIIYPIVILGGYLFALNGLDEAINKQYYPALVGRGIHKVDVIQED